jgi:hypothetical protein
MPQKPWHRSILGKVFDKFRHPGFWAMQNGLLARLSDIKRRRYQCSDSTGCSACYE